MTERPPDIASAIRARLHGVRAWMAEAAPYVSVEQRHLDAHTPERAYWHYGYQTALNDILRLIDGQSDQERRSGDTST
jgi:hypothetical protein